MALRGCGAVLGCGAAIALSEDHKPNRSDERSRIEAAGGVVVWAGTWRVGGVLAVSRAFGDRLLKRYVVRPTVSLRGSWHCLNRDLHCARHPSRLDEHAARRRHPLLLWVLCLPCGDTTIR